MITSHPAAIAYARQAGIATQPGPQIDAEGTVPDLYARAKKLNLSGPNGRTVTTKTKKPDLVAAIERYNAENVATVDTAKLTAAQRRRLRRRGVRGA